MKWKESVWPSLLAIVGLASCGGIPGIDGNWTGMVGILTVEIELSETGGNLTGKITGRLEELSWTADLQGEYDPPSITMDWRYSAQGELVADCDYSGSVDKEGMEMGGDLTCTGLNPYSGPATFIKD